MVWGGAALTTGVAAHKESCLFFFLPLLCGFALACLGGQAPPALAADGTVQAANPPQQALVQRVEFVGNRRIRSDTLKAKIFTREADVYNEETLRRDFQALWNTQFFEDIRLEVEDSPDRPNAKIVIFYVKERPVIRRIEYKGLKSATESEVLERFKDRKVGLSVESQFDPTRIKKAEVVLRELLGEHGRQFAVIKPTYERIAATNAVKLIFNIEEGPKVKVGKIRFQGNQAFSDGKLIRAMRHSRPYGVPLKFFSLDLWSKTYDRRKLNEDLEVGIRGLYQDNGYFKVLVKDPILETVDVNRAGVPMPMPLVGRKHGKVTNITIPIEEGERYRMGKLFFRNADAEKGESLTIKREYLQQVFPLKEGDIFATDKVRKALEDYRKLYGEFGYIDFTAIPLTDVDDQTKTINLTLEFDEQKQFFVRHIEFAGNVTTRDKVIRRELLLDEGDLFNNRLWEISILRLNQLDYFERIKPEHAEIKRNLKEGTVDVILKLKEKGKQSIGLTGGVSGIAGSFIGLSYQTNNFLGLGETLTFSAEFGDRQRNFLFGFTEPYLFDRPISTGFTIFNSRFSFNQSRETSLLLGQRIQLDPNTTQNYNQNSKGFTIFASYPLKRFSFTRIGLTYGLTDTSIAAFSDASRLLFTTLQFRGFAGPSALNGIRSSRLSPTISYNTVDSPINPTHGKSLFYSLSFEGGPLRGNVNALTNVFEGKYFRPVRKRRNVLGFRLLTAFGTGYGDRVLPPFSRFYLGGEDTVRGFDIRTIGPIGFIPVPVNQSIPYFDPTDIDNFGNARLHQVTVPMLAYNITFPGGDIESVGNAEYRIPLVGPVSMDLFFDVGMNGVLRRNQLQLDTSGLQQLRTQFPTATINQTIGLAPGTNFKLRTSTGVQFVVQLPIVNAPFRLYWAYNLNRLHEALVAPQSLFNPDRLPPLPPGVLESQILPRLNAIVTNPQRLNFFEPLRTFRFTVSRTF